MHVRVVRPESWLVRCIRGDLISRQPVGLSSFRTSASQVMDDVDHIGRLSMGGSREVLKAPGAEAESLTVAAGWWGGHSVGEDLDEAWRVSAR